MTVEPRNRGVLSRPMIAAVAALCAVAAGAVLYVRTPLATKIGADACKRSATLARTAVPFEQGDVAAMNAPGTVAPLPMVSFNGPDGKGHTLADFRGKTLLVNLWATWCVPCRQEMPALDKLQAKAGSPRFEIVAINIDTTRLERPRAFLDEIGVKNLAFYADPKADAFYQLKQAGKIVGLPTSFLLGPDGCEIGALAGPADWASDDALALIKSVSGEPGKEPAPDRSPL